VLLLCFLLLHAGLLLLAAHAPFGMLHFAIKGHQVWLESYGTGDANTLPPAAQLTLAAAAAATAGDAPKALRSRASIGGIPAANCQGAQGPHSGRNSIDVKQQHNRRFSLSAVQPVFVPESSYSSCASSPAVQQRRSSFQLQGSIVQTAPVQRGMLHAVKKLLRQICIILAATVIGAAAYVMLLTVVVLALLWAFVTRTVFSLYCIFIPRAADSNCCLKLTCNGDFWGLADVQAAFAAAKLYATHAQQQQASHSRATTHAGDAMCSVAVSDALQPVQSQGRTQSPSAAESFSMAQSALATGVPPARAAEPANSSSSQAGGVCLQGAQDVGQQLFGEVGWESTVLKLTEDGSSMRP
jgi:hypothetical protein